MRELVGPDIVARYAIVDHDATGDAHERVGEVDGVAGAAAARVRARPTSASSPASSSPTSSPASAGAPRRCARGWPPPRPSWRRTIPAASPTRAPPSSPGPATPCTTSCAPPPRWRRRTCRSTWPSTGPARSPPSSPDRCRRPTMPRARSCSRRLCAQVGAPLRPRRARPTAGIRSTATCIRRSRAWRPPSAIVRDGGVIVMAAACEDGVPAGRVRPPAGERRVRRRPGRRRPEGPSSTAGRPRCSGACSPGPRFTCTARDSTTAIIVGALLVPAADLDGAVAAALERLGPRAWVAVLPQGPLTVATVGPSA